MKVLKKMLSLVNLFLLEQDSVNIVMFIQLKLKNNQLKLLKWI